MSGSLVADTIINFDQFSDGDVLSNQIAGVTFTNTVVLTAGISLDEFEFPPHSGSDVASDNGGPVSILFSSPVTSFSGYFTYSEPLVVAGFVSGNSVAQADSHYSSNLALSGVSGSTPNELLQITSAIGFTEVIITGDPAGGSFTMDDISFANTPEPAPFELLWIGSLALIAARVYRKV